jgi:hypothetical protein
MNEPKIGVAVDVQRQRAGAEVMAITWPPNHHAPALTGGIMATKDCIRCALCGREGQLVAFALLAAACKTEGIKLKAPESSYFNPRCARRAFGEVNKKQRRSA